MNSPMNKHPSNGKRQANIPAYATLVIGSIVCLFPFIWLIRSALMGPEQIFTAPPEWIPQPFRWSNFSESLTVQPFWKYFLNTMTLEVLTVSGTVITSTITAFSFARLRWWGRDVVFGILLTSLMMPYIVTLIPTFIFWQKLGLVGTYVPLFLPAWFGGGAFNIFLLRQFFLTIPRDFDEAAYLDGATPLQVLFKIILPLSRPALLVVAIFSFIGVWNDFLGPLIYLQDDSMFTLSLGLATFKGIYNAQWGYLMAASATVVAPIIALYFFTQRYFVEGIAATGVKG
jgi:multiple sugar transport system permease protein